MNRALLPCLALSLLLGACQKQPPATAMATAAAPRTESVDLVKSDERSRNFAAVQKQLELGGSLYGYIDVEGDLKRILGDMKPLLEALAQSDPSLAAIAQQDLVAYADLLGLSDIRAIGLSSVPDGTGYFRNRTYLHAPGPRRGVLAGLGGKPGPLKHIALAPSDAVFFAEAEMDLAAVYKTVKEVISKAAGEEAGNQIERSLRQAGDALTLSLLDLIYGLTGRAAVIVRADATRTMVLPGGDGAPPTTLPQFSVLICIDGIGPIVERSLANIPILRRSDQGSSHVYQSAQMIPLEGVQPAIVIDGTTLYVTTSLPFLVEARAQTTNLSQTPEFQRAVAMLGSESNGLTYISPRLYAQVRRVLDLNPQIPPEARRVVSSYLGQMPAADRPVVSVRTNLEEGILIRSHANVSLKEQLTALSVFPVGLASAMAIPAFQKVRTESQEKAILNNLRMLAAAADQYYLENGVNSTSFDRLVGAERNKYIREVQSIAGEDYRTLRFRSGQPLVVQLPDGRTVRYEP